MPDPTTIAAMAAGLGSVAGATASVVTTFISHRMQMVRGNLEWRQREREALYSAFLTEASRLAVDASLRSLERPDDLVAMYGLLSRIRLIASEEVLNEAEACVRRIVELYQRPNLTPDQFREAIEAHALDPLQDFSVACRQELLASHRGLH